MHTWCIHMLQGGCLCYSRLTNKLLMNNGSTICLWRDHSRLVSFQCFWHGKLAFPQLTHKTVQLQQSLRCRRYNYNIQLFWQHTYNVSKVISYWTTIWSVHVLSSNSIPDLFSYLNKNENKSVFLFERWEENNTKKKLFQEGLLYT